MTPRSRHFAAAKRAPSANPSVSSAAALWPRVFRREKAGPEWKPLKYTKSVCGFLAREFPEFLEAAGRVARPKREWIGGFMLRYPEAGGPQPCPPPRLVAEVAAAGARLHRLVWWGSPEERGRAERGGQTEGEAPSRLLHRKAAPSAFSVCSPAAETEPTAGRTNRMSTNATAK